MMTTLATLMNIVFLTHLVSSIVTYESIEANNELS